MEGCSNTTLLIPFLVKELISLDPFPILAAMKRCLSYLKPHLTSIDHVHFLYGACFVFDLEHILAEIANVWVIPSRAGCPIICIDRRSVI